MTTTWRIVLIGTLISAGLAASLLLGGCDNDVPTPPWLPNYDESGYGGRGGSGGKSAGGAGGASGTSGTGGAKAGAAGEAGAPSDGGEGGVGP